MRQEEKGRDVNVERVEMRFILRCRMCAQSGQLFATPWIVACQAPLPWDFPGKNSGSGWPFPLPGDLSDHPGIELISHASAALAGRFFTAVLLGKP